MKRRLLALLGGAFLTLSAWAQTDVTSTYITNADFSGSYSQFYEIKNDGRYVYQPNGWTVEYINVSEWNMTVVSSSDAMASNFTDNYAVPEGNNKYMVRFRNEQPTEYVDLSQNIRVTEAGFYTFSADMIRENGSKINVELYAGETKVSNANAGTWEKRSFTLELAANTDLKVGVKFTNKGAGGHKAGVDNIKITFKPYVAAPSSYSEVAAGDFYIVNAATGLFLTGANSWGTQASLETHGTPFTVTVGEGVYTLNSHFQENTGTNKCYFNGTYVDGNSTNLYIASLGSGKYSISTAASSEYVTALSSGIVDNSAANADDTHAQWYFVSKSNLESALGNATSSSHKDATFYISDQNFRRNYLASVYNQGTRTLTACESYPWSITASNYNLKGGNNDNFCAESWHATFTLSQELTIPNGMYKLRAQAAEQGSPVAVVYAGDETAAFNSMANGENSMSGMSTQFSLGNYYTDWITAYVTNNTLTVGAKSTSASNWCVWDNFELYYYGPTVGGEATEISMDTETAMAAGKWYYFDIPVGGLYNLTATTLSNIVYTTDGTILIENEGDVTDKFSKAENETLTAGRYFVKSSTAQSLEVTVGAYSYAIGSPTFSTADGGYTQSSTFTITFLGAATNDPGASAALVASSKGTVNGNEADLSAVTNGFSLDLGSLTANTDYNIVIPANVYGYAGESMNAAIDITIHTPAVFDGTYFVRTSTGSYLSRGGNYNTRAIVDEFGLPVTVSTNASGVTQIKYVDSNQYLFDANNGTIYTDNNGSDNNWNIQATAGGCYIINANSRGHNGEKVGIDGFNNVITNNQNCVWVFEALGDHNTYMEALKDFQAATAATDYGITGITTKAALATWLGANCNTDAVSVPSVSFTEKWDGNASAGDEWAGNGMNPYTNTISALPAGLYKLTVNAYYRLNGSATAAEGARGNTYLYGGSAKTQLYSLKDFPAAVEWSGRNQSDAAGYYPDDATSGAAATASSYLTELYVYHTGGNFTYGIHQPSRFSNGEWFGFQNFTLTRYIYIISEDATSAPAPITGDVTLTRSFNASAWNTLVLPFNMTLEEAKAVFGNDITIANYTGTTTLGSGNDQLLFSTESASIVANQPVLIYGVSESGPYDISGRTIVSGTPSFTPAGASYSFTGSYNASTELAAGDYFIGSDNNLYSVGAMLPTMKGTRAFFRPTGGAGVKAAGFSIDDEETGIINLVDGNVNVQTGDIYTLAGQKVQKAKKGVYIVNGKKVVLK